MTEPNWQYLLIRLADAVDYGQPHHVEEVMAEVKQAINLWRAHTMADQLLKAQQMTPPRRGIKLKEDLK